MAFFPNNCQSNMPDIDIKAIEDKLGSARTKLILDKPFLGALIITIANPAWCPTTGTDAGKFYLHASGITRSSPTKPCIAPCEFRPPRPPRQTPLGLGLRLRH